MKKFLVALTLSFAAMASHAADVVRIAVLAEPYPPFSQKLPDGSWEGFEIDLIHKMCTDMKIQCEIVDTAWDGIIPALLSNKVDAIFASMSITKERAKKVLFTHPYYNTLPAVVGLPGQDYSMTKKALKGKFIGVQNGTTSAFYINKKVGSAARIRQYATQDEINSDLLAGRIDYMLADNIAAKEFADKNKGAVQFYGTVKYDPVLGGGVAAALRPNDKALAARFNKEIDQLVKSKFYADLSDKYFGTNIAPTTN